LLGDTTATSALILSPLLLAVPHHQPSYPAYILPPLDLPQYNKTSSSSLVIVPTASSPTNDGLDNSLCAVIATNASTGGVAQNQLVHGTQWMSVGEEGFRAMWAVGDLLASTNYTAWVLDESGGLSSPIWFKTKDGKSKTAQR
jgi:calcium channel MID1